MVTSLPSLMSCFFFLTIFFILYHPTFFTISHSSQSLIVYHLTFLPSLILFHFTFLPFLNFYHLSFSRISLSLSSLIFYYLILYHLSFFSTSHFDHLSFFTICHALSFIFLYHLPFFNILSFFTISQPLLCWEMASTKDTWTKKRKIYLLEG